MFDRVTISALGTIFLILVILSPLLAADDVVVTDFGDRVVGEVKGRAARVQDQHDEHCLRQTDSPR
jgi:hypothetical protein